MRYFASLVISHGSIKQLNFNVQIIPLYLLTVDGTYVTLPAVMKTTDSLTHVTAQLLGNHVHGHGHDHHANHHKLWQSNTSG